MCGNQGNGAFFQPKHFVANSLKKYGISSDSSNDHSYYDVFLPFKPLLFIFREYYNNFANIENLKICPIVTFVDFFGEFLAFMCKSN
jgi:hypothetical protein